jgi:glycine hydroxymethyltransferase
MKTKVALDRAGITVNKNLIPYDPRSPKVTSGIRIGTPALTSRGFGEAEMETVGKLIGRVLRSPHDEMQLAAVRNAVQDLTDAFPVPGIVNEGGIW